MIFLNQKLIALLFFLSFFIAFKDLKAQDTSANNTKSESGSTMENKIKLFLSDESIETKNLIGEEGSKSLYKILLDSFEEFSDWEIKVPYDKASANLSRRIGVPFPLSKKLDSEEGKIDLSQLKGIRERLDNGMYRQYPSSKLKDNKTFVLGAHVNFRQRGHMDIQILTKKPIHMKGLVKNLEIWVSGRQKPFKLYAIMKDINKNQKLIPFGSISHLGWKRLYAHIPDDFYQNNNQLPLDHPGVSFHGFLIRCHPLYTKGDFYIYLDNFSMEISKFGEDYRDLGDPKDNW